MHKKKDKGNQKPTKHFSENHRLNNTNSANNGGEQTLMFFTITNPSIINNVHIYSIFIFLMNILVCA